MWIDDQVLSDAGKSLSVKVWLPEQPMVVLGRSNKIGSEVNIKACFADGVGILKRLGGGGTVLLHSGSLVVSVGVWVGDYYANDRYFNLLNQSLIDCFKRKLPQVPFQQRGYSDIVVGQLKCVGTSLFRSRNYLLYQASILIDAKLDLIEKYLLHPSLEPDYRQGRKHRDFLIDLHSLGVGNTEQWRLLFESELSAIIEFNLVGELRSPQDQQVLHVLSRVGENWLSSEEIDHALKS